MANTPDQTPEEREAQNLAEMTDELALAGQKKDLAKESEKIWDEAVRDVTKKVRKKRTGEQGKNYRFPLGRMTARILKPINKSWEKYSHKKKEINQSNTSPQEKIKALQGLRDELREETTLGVDNAIALIDNMTEKERLITRKSLAQLEVYSVFFEDLMKQEKAKPLITIFDEFIKLRELPNSKVKDLGKTYAEVIEEALLDSQLAPSAFFVLTLAHKGVRKEFGRQFIKKNPEKAIWLIDTGNRYGCFEPSEMKLLFNYAKQEHPELEEKIDKELGNFHYYQRVYELRYNSQQQMAQRAKGMRLNASGNRALQALTFKGTGRFVGSLCAVMTIVANLIANRKVILENPSKVLKNPYILGSVGLLTYLHKTGKGERVGDLLTGKAEREKQKKITAMTQLREVLTSNEEWGRFYAMGGTELLMKHQNETQNKASSLDRLPDMKAFIEFCKKNETETEESKKPSKQLERIAETSGDMATVELGACMSIFRDLSITSSRTYKSMLIEADQTLS
jgi:hypothetical protein